MTTTTHILPNSSSLLSNRHLIHPDLQHSPFRKSRQQQPLLRYALHVALQPYTRRHTSSNSTPTTTTTTTTISTPSFSPAPKLGKKWREYQGVNYWDGLLDPLDDDLRSEILRYGQFVESTYQSFDFDPSSPTYATCKFSRNSLLPACGLDHTGYRVTKFLRATCGLHLPRWFDRGPAWASARSSWIGYVAVCHDKDEIERLGRRDVVIALRGTATCMEWLENLRATLTPLDGDHDCGGGTCPMVESGFLSMYTSGTATCPSLQSAVKSEVARIVDTYGGGGEGEEVAPPPLSFTITGHSLGAALATLVADDIINSTFDGDGDDASPMVTVMSFGGPRVGNGRFRRRLEDGGARILRIVNSDDVITKVPGFVIESSNNNNNNNNNLESRRGGELAGWLKKRVEETAWVYDEVGKELRLSSRESPYLSKRDVATCHELSTYLHLVDGFVSSTCPFRATARRMFNEHGKVGIF